MPAQELGSLSGEGSLPVAPEGAVLMLRDESRMDVLKVLISGPAGVLDAAQDTPYAFGLFEFAVFIPPDYPNEPPLVNLQTTGDGMVRFNPNLYSDGKAPRDLAEICAEIASAVARIWPSSSRATNRRCASRCWARGMARDGWRRRPARRDPPSFR